MFFYNQNNYSGIKYPSSNYPSATVKSGGCGVCSACSALNNLFGKVVYTVQQMAEFSLNNGGRAPNGTDMDVLIKKLRDKLGTFTYTRQYQSGLAEALIKHLKAGGTAILSTTGGTTAPAGLFSSGGHLFAAVGCSGDNIIILDSGYYTGKYNIMNRQKYITVKGTEPYLLVNKKYVQQAAQLGAWLITKKAAKKPTSTLPKVLYCNTTAGLKFRKGASTSANFVDGANSGKSIIGYGDKVEVIAKSGSWWKIKYRGLTGYAHGAYLQATPPSVKKITIGSGRNIRAGAGLNAKVMFTTNKAITANLLVDRYWNKNGYRWSRISYNGKTYYVADV